MSASQPLGDEVASPALIRMAGFSRIKAQLARYGYPVGLALVALSLWEICVLLLRVPEYLLPGPHVIALSLFDNWSVIGVNIWPTLMEVLVGYLLSIAIGVPLAIAIVYSKLAEQTLYPPLVASQAIPKVAIAPLFIVWMGYGIMPKVWIAFLIAFFPIVIDTVVGLRSIPQELLQLGRSMGAGSLRVFVKLRLPSALPNLFGGLKIAVTLAVVGAITGEFVGSERGLGYMLTSASGNMDTPLVFAILVVISLIAVVLFVLVEILERLVIPWHTSVRSRRTGLA